MSLVNRAIEIVEGRMTLFDCLDEFVCCVNIDTDLIVMEHVYKGSTFGWNIYVRSGQDLKLIETYDVENDANSVVEMIYDGLAFGATYFMLPDI